MNFLSCGFVEGECAWLLGATNSDILSLIDLPPPKYSGSLGGGLSARGIGLLEMFVYGQRNREFSLFLWCGRGIFVVSGSHQLRNCCSQICYRPNIPISGIIFVFMWEHLLVKVCKWLHKS